MLIEEDGDYILNTCYGPSGHGHWNFSTLYQYNTTERKIEQSADFVRYYSGTAEAPAFYSHIYIQDNTYRIKYGEVDRTTLKEEDPINDTWLYRKDSINTIHVPRAYEKSFQWLNSERFQILKHVKFY